MIDLDAIRERDRGDHMAVWPWTGIAGEAIRDRRALLAEIDRLRAVAATWAKKQGLNPTALLMHSSAAQTVRYLRDKEEPLVEGPSFGQSNRQPGNKA